MATILDLPIEDITLTAVMDFIKSNGAVVDHIEDNTVRAHILVDGPLDNSEIKHRISYILDTKWKFKFLTRRVKQSYINKDIERTKGIKSKDGYITYGDNKA